jgi:hypothetical protein
MVVPEFWIFKFKFKLAGIFVCFSRILDFYGNFGRFCWFFVWLPGWLAYTVIFIKTESVEIFINHFPQDYVAWKIWHFWNTFQQILFVNES